jgi:hypothetical protein
MHALCATQDGKGGMGRQMSKLLKRKKDKKNDVTVVRNLPAPVVTTPFLRTALWNLS